MPLPGGQSGEIYILERLRKRFHSGADELIVGIGDDAALVKTDSEEILLTMDTLSEGVHFDLSYMTSYQVGFRLAVSNISDIHAMGGIPVWALLSVSIPGGRIDGFLDEFLSGLDDALRRYSITLAGGDMTGSRGGITVTLALTGKRGENLARRSGARPGDRIFITGPPGEASLGHELIKRVGLPVRLETGETLDISIPFEKVEPLVRRFLLPELPPVPPGVNSMIDTSDGLMIDLWRLCRESRAGARIFEEALPLTEGMLMVSEAFGIDLMEHVFGGGEDFHLLFTGPEGMEGAFEIGEVTEGESIFLVKKDESEEMIKPTGYVHFVSR